MSASPLLERLRALTALDAPVGFEEPVLEAARASLAACCDRVESDLRGNVYAYQAGRDASAPRVMITAHADEVGFMVTSVLPCGHLRFARLGKPTAMVLPGQRVRVLTTAGALEGVIGVKPGHVLSGEEANRLPALRDLYIDVGAESAAQAADWGIEPGTPAVFVGPLTRTGNPHRWLGKAVDNRMGVLAVLEAAERLAEATAPCERVYVIAVEEEVGLRGAEVAARHVDPDVVLAVDTVPSGGTPDLRPDDLPWEIGKGPLLKVRETIGLSTSRPLRELIRASAARASLPYQLIVDTAGITDATSAQQASGRIAAAVIGLARKYSHSAAELFDARDLEALIDLVVAVSRDIEHVDQLRRLPAGGG